MSQERAPVRGRCQLKSPFHALLLAGSWAIASAAMANAPSSVTIEIVDADGSAFREFPVTARDGALRSSAGTGYGDRRVDRAVNVGFVASANADSRHFIRDEWRETLCRKHLVECGEKNRFRDESTLGFAPPPPRRR